MEIRSEALTLQPLDRAGTVNLAMEHSPAATSQAPEDVASLTFGQLLSSDDIRANRVQALQGQIASGTYQVTAQDLASTLLNSLADNA